LLSTHEQESCLSVGRFAAPPRVSLFFCFGVRLYEGKGRAKEINVWLTDVLSFNGAQIGGLTDKTSEKMPAFTESLGYAPWLFPSSFATVGYSVYIWALKNQ
jgi:hypothetical protein